MPSGELYVQRRKITYNPDIALAMYRELASHLEQITDVSVELFGQESTEFSYLGSQIGGLLLSHPRNLSLRSLVLIETILNYYGTWTSENQE
ncbi:MAG: hypothetical protein ACKPCM_03370 [Pseudanabaena sp.]